MTSTEAPRQQAAPRGPAVAYEIRRGPQGDLVLVRPGDDDPRRETLDVPSRVRLAERAATGRPVTVVENEDGDHVVLVGEPVDPDRHVPLSLDDAERLVGDEPVYARFGLRDDDLLALTPWSADDDVTVFDPDDPAFRDVAVVRLAEWAGDESDAENALLIERGRLDEPLRRAVLQHLADEVAEPGVRFGVLTNVFGEFTCVQVGEPIEPYEDVRHQTVLRGVSVLQGVASLREAAEYLRAYADRLQRAHERGWVLPHAILGDYAVLERRPPVQDGVTGRDRDHRSPDNP